MDALGDTEGDLEELAEGEILADGEMLGDLDELADGDTEGDALGLGLVLGDTEGEAVPVAADHEANTPADSVEELKSAVNVKFVWALAKVSLAPEHIKYVSTDPSYFSVTPVHDVVAPLTAVQAAPIANPPAGTSMAYVGSAAVLVDESAAVALDIPVALHIPIMHLKTVVLHVTTTSPVVPEGTAAIAIAEALLFVAVFVTC